jgi:hypothetical protein
VKHENFLWIEIEANGFRGFIKSNEFKNLKNTNLNENETSISGFIELKNLDIYNEPNGNKLKFCKEFTKKDECDFLFSEINIGSIFQMFNLVKGKTEDFFQIEINFQSHYVPKSSATFFDSSIYNYTKNKYEKKFDPVLLESINNYFEDDIHVWSIQIQNLPN